MIEPGARNPGAGAGVGSFETRYVFELVVLVSFCFFLTMLLVLDAPCFFIMMWILWGFHDLVHVLRIPFSGSSAPNNFGWGVCR